MHFTRKRARSKNPFSPRALVKTHEPGGLAEECGIRTEPFRDVTNLAEARGGAPPFRRWVQKQGAGFCGLCRVDRTVYTVSVQTTQIQRTCFLKSTCVTNTLYPFP